MLRRATCISLLWFAFAIYMSLSGCCGCKDNSHAIQYCVNVSSATLTPYDNSGTEPVPAGAQSIPGRALILELQLQHEDAVCFKSPPKSFFNAAYAFTCKQKTEGRLIDSVKFVSIVADIPYDDIHPAGVELNEYFKMPPVGDYNYIGEMADGAFRFYALQAPQQAQVVVYTARILFNSGKTIEVTTQPLSIVP
ncbi:MAG: DUF5034 domain-containing protein [Taibaiella sp.]|nr:DUF5034 domain-containing protein [Taibaiella sp.]